LTGWSEKELDVVKSNILGFHVYKNAWMPVTGEVLVKWRTSIGLSPHFCDLLDASYLMPY